MVKDAKSMHGWQISTNQITYTTMQVATHYYFPVPYCIYILYMCVCAYHARTESDALSSTTAKIIESTDQAQAAESQRTATWKEEDLLLCHICSVQLRSSVGSELFLALFAFNHEG